MKRPRLTFSRDDKLLKKREFELVFRKGRRIRGENVEFICLPNGKDRSRLGLVVPRKVGKAVKRNRIRRVFREIFRTRRFDIKKNVDLVIRVFPGFDARDYRKVDEEFTKFARKVGDN